MNIELQSLYEMFQISALALSLSTLKTTLAKLLNVWQFLLKKLLRFFKNFFGVLTHDQSHPINPKP